MRGRYQPDCTWCARRLPATVSHGHVKVFHFLQKDPIRSLRNLTVPTALHPLPNGGLLPVRERHIWASCCIRATGFNPENFVWNKVFFVYILG